MDVCTNGTEALVGKTAGTLTNRAVTANGSSKLLIIVFFIATLSQFKTKPFLVKNVLIKQ